MMQTLHLIAAGRPEQLLMGKGIIGVGHVTVIARHISSGKY